MAIQPSHHIIDLMPFKTGRSIESVRREFKILNKPIIKMASNENPLGVSPFVSDYICSDQFHLYPDAKAYELKRKLSTLHNIEVEQIIIGNGSEDILTAAALAFVVPGKKVIVTQHGFPTYHLITRKVAGILRIVPAIRGEHALSSMIEAIDDNTSLIFIANPRNPTGTMIAKTALDEFLSMVPSRVLVVLDEAYNEYVLDSEYPQGCRFINQHDNLLVTRTFSKIYGLAGLRLGYGIAQRALIETLRKVCMPYNVNRVAMQVGCIALDDQEHIARSRSMNALNKQKLWSALTSLGLTLQGEHGNFIMVHLGDDAGKVCHALLHEGFIVRWLDSFGLPDYIRITVGTLAQNEKFIHVLKGILYD